MNTTNKTEKAKTQATKATITPFDYAVKIFDGMFSESQIENNRKTVFYRIANAPTPKGNLLGNIMDQDEIGSVINELAQLQFNRRFQAKASRMQDQADF